MRKTAVKYHVPVLAGSWYVVHRGVAHAAKQIKPGLKRVQFLQKNAIKAFNWEYLFYSENADKLLLPPQDLQLLRQKDAVLVSNAVNMTVWTVARIKSRAKQIDMFGGGKTASAVETTRTGRQDLGKTSLALEPNFASLRRGRQQL